MEKSPGTIIHYLPERGHGHLRLTGTREEFFFRTKNLRYPNAKAGDRVTFVLREGRMGYFADEIELSALT